MANEQGVATTLSRVKQSGLGSPGSSGSKLMRRVTFGLNKSAQKYSSAEIASHQQSTGATEGPSSVQGPLNAELSAGTYDLEFAALLRKDFAAAFTSITSVALTIAASGSLYTVTRGSGDFLTGGVKIGHVVRLSVGTLDAANINKNLLVVGVTATVLTVTPLNGSSMTAEGPIAGCTVASAGKETHTPTTGHTNDYFSWERKFNTLSRYELFTDVKVSSADISFPATGIPTVNFALSGLGRSPSASETLTSPTAESTSSVLTSARGKIAINGAVTSVTGIQMQITGNITTGEAEVGNNSYSDLQRGRIAVTGTFTAKFSSVTLQTIRDNQTAVTLIASLADDATATANFIVITLPAIKLFTDDIDDGEKELIRSYQFEAQYYGAGGASLAQHATICMIQDSLAA